MMKKKSYNKLFPLPPWENHRPQNQNQHPLSYVTLVLQQCSVSGSPAGDTNKSLSSFDKDFPCPPWNQPAPPQNLEDVPPIVQTEVEAVPVKSNTRRRRRKKAKRGNKKNKVIKEAEVQNGEIGSTPENSPRKRLLFTAKTLKMKWICCRYCGLGLIHQGAEVTAIDGVIVKGMKECRDFVELAEDSLVAPNFQIEDQNYIIEINQCFSTVSSLRCQCGVRVGYLYRSSAYGKPALRLDTTGLCAKLTQDSTENRPVIRCLLEECHIQLSDVP